MSDNFKLLLVLPAKLNGTIEHVSSTFKQTKSAFIRESILERLEAIRQNSGGNRKYKYMNVWQLKLDINKIIKSLYGSDSFWLCMQFLFACFGVYACSRITM